MPSKPERRKLLQYNRDRGLGFRMTAEEAAPAHRKITSFRRSGMSFRQMSQACGVPYSTITVFAKHGQGSKNGKGGLYRTHYNALMRMEFQTSTGAHDGARDATAAILGARRLNALRASGWPIATIVEMLPVYNAANVRLLCIGECTGIGPVAADAIRTLYDKIKYADPADYGVSTTSQKKARHYAKGAPTVDCWDEDTIDDPDALPEWTGACGTEEGYRIHVRETFFGNRQMPPCPPCRAVVETRHPGERKRYPLNREHLTEAVKNSPLTGLQIGEGIYGAENRGGYRGRDVLHRWRDGSRQPRNLNIVEKLAAVLDVDVDWLLDTEVIAAEDSQPAHKVGNFNPFVLRVALDLDGLSFSKAGALPGSTVSKGAVNSWASGTSTPSSPAKVQFLADYFGVDLDIFYS